LKKVSINILNTNEREFLEKTLPLILDQTYPEYEVILTDNASTDGSVEYVREHFPEVRILQNEENLGYVGGHNRGIAETDGDYVMLLNADIFLKPDFLEEKVKAVEYADDVGSAEGKLLQIRPDEERFPDYKIFDSTGLAINRMRKNSDRAYGVEDVGQYDREEFVFGPSGATPLYKREMLEDIRIDDEYLDSTFFIYREEVDLAWRAQIQGWKCRYTPKAVAYHVRGYSPKTPEEYAPLLPPAAVPEPLPHAGQERVDPKSPGRPAPLPPLRVPPVRLRRDPRTPPLQGLSSVFRALPRGSSEAEDHRLAETGHRRIPPAVVSIGRRAIRIPLGISRRIDDHPGEQRRCSSSPGSIQPSPTSHISP